MRRYRLAGIGLSLGLVALTTGCLDVTDPLESLFWETDFVATDVESGISLTGSVAMVATQFQTEAGVSVEDVSGDGTLESLGWHVRSGSCGGEGQPVTLNFPTLTFSETGTSSGSVVIGRRIVEEASYVMELFVEIDTTGDPFFCTELPRR